MRKPRILHNPKTVVHIRSRKKARREALLTAKAYANHKPGIPGREDLHRDLARRMRRLDQVFGHRAEQVHNAIQKRAIAAWRSKS